LVEKGQLGQNAAEPLPKRLDWASSQDEGRVALLIAAALYLVGAVLTVTAVMDPRVSSPAGVAGVAVAACLTAAALLVAARGGYGGLGVACLADLWGIVLIALLCAATGGAYSPFALIYFFAICHAAAFQPRRRFALVCLAALLAFLVPLVYGSVPPGYAPFASVGVVLALLISCVIHVALGSIRAQRRRLEFMIAASAKLDTSLDPSQTLRKMAHSAVPELAELCVIDLVDRHGWIETVAASVDPGLAERVEQMRREAPLDLAGSHPVARALATGSPQIVDDLTQPRTLQAAAQSTEHLRFMREVQYRSAAVFPLTARHRTHGAISFLHVANDASYSEGELGVLEDLTARAALAYDNARLYAERAHIANALQRSLMPPKLPEIPWLGLASHFQPIGAANRVGGDFYDAFQDDRRCWLVVGDVCGKGPEAAAYTGLLRQSTRAYARRAESPAAVLAHVNQTMLDQEFAEGFATAVLVLLQRRGQEVEALIASAGHPPAVVVRDDGRVEEFGHGALLGRFAGVHVDDVPTSLHPGDALALYTDGLPEAHAPERIVSVEEMTAPLRSHSPRSARHVVEALLKPVAQDKDVRDDIAILAALARQPAG
jgi:serine phosphatase RsbU (regulator of sigma subunit)